MTLQPRPTERKQTHRLQITLNVTENITHKNNQASPRHRSKLFGRARRATCHRQHVRKTEPQHLINCAGFSQRTNAQHQLTLKPSVRMCLPCIAYCYTCFSMIVGPLPKLLHVPPRSCAPGPFMTTARAVDSIHEPAVGGGGGSATRREITRTVEASRQENEGITGVPFLLEHSPGERGVIASCRPASLLGDILIPDQRPPPVRSSKHLEH